jgi:hypothetical protein
MLDCRRAAALAFRACCSCGIVLRWLERICADRLEPGHPARFLANGLGAGNSLGLHADDLGAGSLRHARLRLGIGGTGHSCSTDADCPD